MSNICAGIGRGQMEVLDQHIALRKKNNDFYKKEFVNCDGVNVFTEPSDAFQSNHWLSCILIDKSLTEGKGVDDLRLAFESDNIESRPLWKPMHLQPVFNTAPYYGERVAETLFNNGLCLPSASNLTADDLERIKKIITAVFN